MSDIIHSPESILNCRLVSELDVLSNLNFGKNVCSTLPKFKSPLFGGKLFSSICKIEKY